MAIFRHMALSLLALRKDGKVRDEEQTHNSRRADNEYLEWVLQGAIDQKCQIRSPWSITLLHNKTHATVAEAVKTSHYKFMERGIFHPVVCPGANKLS